MRKRAFNKAVFAYPYILICALFVIFPLVLVAVYAFRGKDGGFTFANFINVFTNESNYLSLLRTLGTALITTVITLLIAYPLAMVLASSRFNKITILALLFVVPMWLNFVLRMYALRSVLNMIGIGNSYLAAIIGLVYDFLPFMLLPIYTILVNMDKSYIEASKDLGAGSFSTFMRVIMPLSIPGVVSGVMMVFMPTFSAYAVTGILGDANSGVIGGKIDSLFANNLWGVGSALAFVLMVLVVAIMLLSNITRGHKAKSVPNAPITKGGGII